MYRFEGSLEPRPQKCCWEQWKDHRLQRQTGSNLASALLTTCVSSAGSRNLPHSDSSAKWESWVCPHKGAFNETEWSVGLKDWGLGRQAMASLLSALWLGMEAMIQGCNSASTYFCFVFFCSALQQPRGFTVCAVGEGFLNLEVPTNSRRGGKSHFHREWETLLDKASMWRKKHRCHQTAGEPQGLATLSPPNRKRCKWPEIP